MRLAGLIRLFRHGASCAVAVFFCMGAARAELEDPAALQAARQQALAKNVADHPVWRALLHYPTGKSRSDISDPTFFCAPDGADNPEAELLATLDALFAPAATNELEHARCRCPARFDWLVEQGLFRRDAVSVPDCRVFDRAVAHLKPTSVTVSFPSAYLNSPASMFGHTLLVFDSAEEDRILSKAVNFAARTTTSCGPIFTIAGIFGGYRGYYAVTPYYDLVEKYNAISQRDIWEYELELSPDEVHRVFSHVWEMQNRFAPYYFFNGNCSYHLIMLLNVARPDLTLDADFGFQVIPLDTVRSLRKRDLVRSVSFRPSKATEIRGLVGGLDDAERKAVAAALGKLREGEKRGDGLRAAAGDEEAERAMLQVTAELWQQDYAQERVDAKTYRKALVPLLGERAKLGQLEDPDRWRLPKGAEPDSGHRAWRVQAGAGRAGDTNFAELRLRPAYHTLTDAPRGFADGSQIVFLDGTVRYLESPGRVRLQRMDYVDIRSFAPVEPFHPHNSWKVRVAGERLTGSEDEGWSHTVHTGKGKTWRLGANQYVAATVDLKGDVGSVWHSGWRAGAGGALHWFRTGERFSQLAEVEGQQLWGDGSPQERWAVRVQAQWHIGTQWGLVLDAERKDEGTGDPVGEFSLGIKRHFD